MDLVSGVVFSLIVLKVLLLFKIVFLPRLIEKSSLERLRRVKVAFLCRHSLLVLKHLLVDLLDHSQLVDVNLDFVLEILEHSEDGEAVTNFHILVEQPSS